MEFSIREGFDSEVYIESAMVFGELLDNFYPEAFEDSYDFSSMFESEGSKPSKADSAVKGGFISSIKNAYNALIKKLKEIIKKCKDALTLKFASAETKAKIKELQDAIDERPELKGVKVTVSDYEKCNRIYGEAEKQGIVAMKMAEKNDMDPAELKEKLDAIVETTEKAIPSAVKAVALVGLSAVAAGLIKNLDTTLKEAGDKANEFSANLTETIANLGHKKPDDDGKKNTRRARRRLVGDGFLSWLAGSKSKKSTEGVGSFIANCGRAIRGDKYAKANVESRVLTSNSAAAKAVRNTLAFGGRVSGAIAQRGNNAKKKGK